MVMFMIKSKVLKLYVSVKFWKVSDTRDIIFFAEINKHYLLDVKGDLWQKK